METLTVSLTTLCLICLSIILLICFFMLCINVAKIKNHLLNSYSSEKFKKMAEKEIFLGNSDKARFYIENAKYKVEKSNSLINYFNNINKEDKLRELNILKNKII